MKVLLPWKHSLCTCCGNGSLVLFIQNQESKRLYKERKTWRQRKSWSASFPFSASKAAEICCVSQGHQLQLLIFNITELCNNLEALLPVLMNSHPLYDCTVCLRMKPQTSVFNIKGCEAKGERCLIQLGNKAYIMMLGLLLISAWSHLQVHPLPPQWPIFFWLECYSANQNVWLVRHTRQLV